MLFDAIDKAYKADGKFTREGIVRELFNTKNYDHVFGSWSGEDIFTPTSTLTGHSNFVRSVAFSPNGASWPAAVQMRRS